MNELYGFLEVCTLYLIIVISIICIITFYVVFIHVKDEPKINNIIEFILFAHGKD